MQIMIVVNSHELGRALEQMLQCRFETYICYDPEEAAEALAQRKPQALIISLMLPGADGLSLLERCAQHLPPVILALTPSSSPYTVHKAAQLGVGYMMLDGCEAAAIVCRIMEMISCMHLPPRQLEEPRSKTTLRLLELGLDASCDGFRQLQMSIPLFAQDTCQKVCKEIYPAVAQLGGFNSGQQVEHAIRTAIERAWSTRDPALWAQYFPGNTDKCPSNKKFISRMAANL